MGLPTVDMRVLIYLVGIAFSSLLCMASYAFLAYGIFAFIKAKRANTAQPDEYTQSQVKNKLILMIISICLVVFALTVLSVVTFMYAMAFVV